MASEERDRKFDQALARHLRSAAPPTEAAGAAAASRSQHPDAETLAAYHERSLLSEEMNSWKEHIVGCGQCQTILAHLEITDEIPLGAAENEELVAAGCVAPLLASAPRADEALSSLRVSNVDEFRDRLAVRAKKSDLRFLRRPRWRWLAPAGAIAAGLLVWIAMHENPSIPLRSASEPKIASKSPVAPPPSPSQPASSSPSSASPSNARSAPQEITASNGRVASKAPSKQNTTELADESKIASAPVSADKEGGLRKDTERRESEGFSRATRVGSLDAKSVPGGVVDGLSGATREKTESHAQPQTPSSEVAGATQQVQVEDQAANAQQQNQVNNNLQKIPGPAPMGQANTTQSLKKAGRAKPAAPPAAPAAGAMSYETAPSMDLVAASNLRLIVAPGGGVIWRIGPAGSIQFSKDKGSSWSPQTSGVSADLLAGSAPSDKICWLVGRTGTILLTNDGGAHWKPVNSPLANDLGGVNATSVLRATIWDLRNTRFFETTDGGQTWNRLPNR